MAENLRTEIVPHNDMHIYNCAGIILFNNKMDKLVLVCSPKGYYSFPKGKREKGETLFDTAFRETLEETGIKQESIKITNYVITEYKKPNSPNPSVVYFIGQLQSDYKKVKFTFDTDELDNVAWYDVDKVFKLDGLRDKRKNVLKEAMEYFKDVNSDLFFREHLE